MDETSYPELLPRASADAIRRNWMPADATMVTVRFANPGTRGPSFKIDRGQSLLLAEITLAGVVERRIRLGVFTSSHDL
jgi:hypothetical protein